MHLLSRGLTYSVSHDIEASHSIPQSSELVESSLVSNSCPLTSSSELCFSPLVSQRTLLLTVWSSDQQHQHPVEAVHKIPPRLKNDSLRSVPSLHLTRSKNGHFWGRSPLERAVHMSGRFSTFYISFISSPTITEYAFYPKHRAQNKYKDMNIRHGLLHTTFTVHKQINTFYIGKVLL